MKLEDIDAVGDLKNKLWKAFDLLRTEPVSSVDYDIVFYFLLLQKFGFLDQVKTLESNHLRPWILDCVLQPAHDNSDPYYGMRSVFEPILYSMSDSAIHSICDLMSGLNQPVLLGNFAEIFDDLYLRYFKTRKIFGEIFIPFEISSFISDLTKVKEGETVYNPFAGIASIGVSLDENVTYYGQESNIKVWALGALRLLAHEAPSKSYLTLGDPVNHWNPFAKRYDAIVSCPPFNVRLRQIQNGHIGEIRSIEHFLLENGINDLKMDGKFILLLPSGFASSAGINQIYRRYLVEKDLIDMAISFPGGLLYNTSISFLILVICKSKKEKGSVLLVDARKHIEDSNGEKRLNVDSLNSEIFGNKKLDQVRRIANSKIAELNYSFNSSRYLYDQIEGTALSELFNVIRGQRNNEGSVGKLIRIRDMKDDKIAYQLDTQLIEDAEIPKHAQKIEESCLILSLRWKSLKPTYFKSSGTSIYLTNDAIALRVNEEKVDIAYLINELHSDYVLEQIDAFRSGGVIPSITKDDLLSVKIELPLPEIQRAKIKGVIEVFADKKREELAFFKKIHGLESEIIEQNSYLRHSLAGPTSNLRSSIINIRTILNEYVVPSFPGILNLKVNDNYKFTFNDYLTFLERDTKVIDAALSKHLKIENDIKSKALVPIEIVSFIQKYINEYLERKDLNFKIEFSLDSEVYNDSHGVLRKVFILGNSDLLSSMFDNLIENAVMHAFETPGNNRIEIFLMYYPNEDREYKEGKDQVQILVSNTGKPFVSDEALSNFWKKGSKSALSSGDGFGGWYIDEIINYLGGNYDIIDETGAEGFEDSDLATSFEINFPALNFENYEEV